MKFEPFMVLNYTIVYFSNHLMNLSHVCMSVQLYIEIELCQKKKKIMGPTMRLQWLGDVYLQCLVAFIWLVMSLLPPIFVCRHEKYRRETNYHSPTSPNCA